MTRTVRPIAPPVSAGRLATLLFCAAGAMLFLALLATVLVLREEQTFLFRAHSGLLPKTVQTLGTALLLGACGLCTLASRFKNMLTADRNVRVYTTLALLGAIACGLGYCAVTAREWSVMFDRATVVSRVPPDYFEKAGVRKSRPGSGTAAPASPSVVSTLTTAPVDRLYVTDAFFLNHAQPELVMDGVSAPVPPNVDFDIHRISRPEIAAWSDAAWGKIRIRPQDVVAVQYHGPQKNVVYASFFALSSAAVLMAIGLTFVTIVLLARQLLGKRVFETSANLGVLWGFLAIAWVFSRMTL